MINRFTITVTDYQWSCGDGCCSDSGYKLKVWDNEQNKYLFDGDDWEARHDKDSRIAEGVALIEDEIKEPAVKDVDYNVVEDYEDDTVPYDNEDGDNSN